MSHVSKPIDNWRVGDPKQPLTEWRRPMTEKTLEKRFVQWNEISEAIAIVASYRGKVSVHGALLGTCCPECGATMRVNSIELASGDRVHWLQCHAPCADNDHGYGKFSKHGNRAPFGRSPRGSGVTVNEPDPVFEPVPEPKPEPEPEPVTLPKGKAYHERFADVVRLVKAGVRALLLEGPAGSGKTSIGYMLAETLGYPSVTVSGCRETEKGELTKRAHPVTGKESLSAFLSALVNGPAVGIIDEGDGIPPDVLLAMNEPVANRRLTVNGEVVHLHPDAVIILTANCTNGTSRVYTGRYPMDGATKSRFLPVFCDYSPSIENAICNDRSLKDAVMAVRSRVNNDPQLAKSFAAMCGTRLILQSMDVGRAFGKVGREALRALIELGNPPEVSRQLLGE